MRKQVKRSFGAEVAVSRTGPAGGQLAQVMERLRTGTSTEDSQAYADLAVQFMAPVTTVFACWVLGEARKQGIERLYFLSRDCQLTWKAAQVLSSEFGDIDCRYLQISKSILLPSSSDISEEGMPWLFGENETPVLGGLLARLELDYEGFIPFFPQAKNEGALYVLRTTEDRLAFWSALRQPVLYEKMTQLVRHRRNAARSYFETQGLFDSVRWAVVDVGWALNIQTALNELMSSWGHAGTVRGLYLGAVWNRKLMHETGPMNALFYGDLSNGIKKEKQPIVFKNIILIENLLGTADHPTVHRYEFDEGGVGVPEYHREVPVETLARFHALEKWIHVFAKRLVPFSVDLADPTVSSAIVEALIVSLFETNDLNMVKPLMGVQFSFTRDCLHQHPLVRPLTWTEAITPIFPSWPLLEIFRKNPSVMWHKGSVIVSKGWVQKLYRTAYRVRSVRMRFKWFR